MNSTEAGIKRFKENYGEINRENMAHFFGVKKAEIKKIEERTLGTSLEEYRKIHRVSSLLLL